MPYVKSQLISRAGYSGIGGFTDTIGDIAKGALSFFGSQQRAQGAADAAMATNRDLQSALVAQQGVSTDTLIVGAAVVGLAAFLLLRKKKHA